MQLIHILRTENLDRNLYQPLELYLADEVLKNPEVYRMTTMGKGSFRILDNSLNELGDSMGLEKLAAAAEIILPDEIVLPDKINPEESRAATEGALTELWNYPELRGIRTMAVVHASTFEEYLEEMYRLDKDDRVSTVGIPKTVAKNLSNGEGLSGRVKLLEAAIFGGYRKTTHFLGWAGFEEFSGYEYLTNYIRSMDSRLMLGADSLWHREDILSHVDLGSGKIENIEQRMEQVREVYLSFGLC